MVQTTPESLGVPFDEMAIIEQAGWMPLYNHATDILAGNTRGPLMVPSNEFYGSNGNN